MQVRPKARLQHPLRYEPAVESGGTLALAGDARSVTPWDSRSAQSSERWFEAEEESRLAERRDFLARRGAYDRQVNALWAGVKAAMMEGIGVHNARTRDAVECAETPRGGLAVTKFRRPLALIDMTVDIDSGMIACVYTFAAHDDPQYRECLNVLLVGATETEMFLKTQHGHRLTTFDDAAHEILTPYLARLGARGLDPQ